VEAFFRYGTWGISVKLKGSVRGAATAPTDWGLVMRSIVVRKLVRLVFVLLLVSGATAFMLDLTPGDPAYAILGPSATPEAVAAVHADLGLDRPVIERYVDWIGNVAHGDFGRSYRANVPKEARQEVSTLIREALPVTIELVLVTLLLSVLAAVPIATLCAHRAGGRLDRFVTVATSVLVSTPPFVTVPILVYFFVLKAGVLPATGWVRLTEDPIENLRHVVLPAFALSCVPFAQFVTVLRNDLVNTLNEDFILQARAKGLSPTSVLIRHALRPSSFSLLTIGGLALGQLVAGAVIAENLFALPGIGTLIVTSIQAKDIATVQGVVMFVATVYVVANAVVDILHARLDPRIRLEGAAV
jgi:peptide/nickel transport system permease protein